MFFAVFLILKKKDDGKVEKDDRKMERGGRKMEKGGRREVAVETDSWHMNSSVFGTEKGDQTESEQSGNVKSTQTGTEKEENGNRIRNMISAEDDMRKKAYEKAQRQLKTE